MIMMMMMMMMMTTVTMINAYDSYMYTVTAIFTTTNVKTICHSSI